ncbi:hypothetical protein [Ensifer canadensis]
MENVTLEIVRLAVQALTPIIVGYIGWKVSKRLKDIEQNQWANRKITEKRIQIYEKVSPLLNRLFCYFNYVGDWQRHSPKDIISTKRELDHEIHVNRYLLDPAVFDAYHKFIHTLFEHYTGAGEDAKLRTLVVSADGDRSQSTFFQWNVEWAHCFNSHDVASKQHVFELYDAVMRAQRNGINA